MPNQSLTVRFGGSAVNLPIVRFEMSKAFSKHTVGTIDFKYGDADTPTAGVYIWPEWTPVTVDLTSGSDRDRWYGYVHSGGTESDNRLGASVVRYTVIGTSLPMNEERTRSWSHVTRSGIVRMVAREHGLRTIVQRDREVLSYVAQPGKSDWKLLKQMAEESAYRLWVDGSTVLFIDPETALTGVRSPDVRRFVHNAIVGMPDSIMVWKTDRGSMLPRSGGMAAKHSASGLDPRTGRVVRATSTNTIGGPSLTSINTDRRVRDQAHASRVVGAAAARSRGWVTATAVVSCSPSIRPGSVVEIDGGAVPVDERGLWLVTEAAHRAMFDGSTKQQYTTTLTLERNQYYAPTFNNAFRTINTADSVPAIMRNGLYWEASVQEDVRVG